MELWPVGLPQKLNVDGHTYQLGDPTIRSNPSVGPSKIRPRSSAIASPLNGQMFMTTAQVETLRYFYQVTLRGAEVFEFPDPERGPSSPDVTIYCRFAGSPTITATHVAGVWSVALPMEILP